MTWMVAWLFACGEPEPVLRAVKAPPTAEQVAAKRDAQELRASPKAMEVAYEKPAGVYIDARFLGGRSWTGVRDEIERQFGAVLEETRTAEGDREVRFDRGRIRIHAERIQMVEVLFPEPLRRSEALLQLGFPATTAEYRPYAKEFRLANVWDFRRLVFHRAAPGSEQIDGVQAWKFSTSDR